MYDSKAIQLINQIAYFFRKEKKYDAANRLFEALLRFHPEHSNALLGQGIVYAEQGKFDDAQLRLQQVLAHKPEHIFAMTCLGLVQLHKGHPGWRDLLMQAAQNKEGFMAQEILKMVGPAQQKRGMLRSGSSSTRLKRSGISMEVV